MDAISRVLHAAHASLGTPYVFRREQIDALTQAGVRTGNCFTQMQAWMGAAGYELPGCLYGQLSHGITLQAHEDLRPGDIIDLQAWWGGYGALNVGHQCLYVGDGFVADASPIHGKTVLQSAMPYLHGTRFVRCRRILT